MLEFIHILVTILFNRMDPSLTVVFQISQLSSLSTLKSEGMPNNIYSIFEISENNIFRL